MVRRIAWIAQAHIPGLTPSPVHVCAVFLPLQRWSGAGCVYLLDCPSGDSGPSNALFRLGCACAALLAVGVLRYVALASFGAWRVRTRRQLKASHVLLGVKVAAATAFGVLLGVVRAGLRGSFLVTWTSSRSTSVCMAVISCVSGGPLVLHDPAPTTVVLPLFFARLGASGGAICRQVQ
jgi:hypothetical protein